MCGTGRGDVGKERDAVDLVVVKQDGVDVQHLVEAHALRIVDLHADVALKQNELVHLWLDRAVERVGGLDGSVAGEGLGRQIDALVLVLVHLVDLGDLLLVDAEGTEVLLDFRLGALAAPAAIACLVQRFARASTRNSSGGTVSMTTLLQSYLRVRVPLKVWVSSSREPSNSSMSSWDARPMASSYDSPSKVSSLYS
jgi:hypothetical protein